MALFDNGFKLGGSIAVGAGVMILAPIVVPIVASALRPVVKAAIKGGMIAYGKMKETAAETAETIEDLAAEAKSELGASSAAKVTRGKKAATAKA
jgi:hypothetical protein